MNMNKNTKYPYVEILMFHFVANEMSLKKQKLKTLIQLRNFKQV